jgi:molecular chaperone DnaK
MPQIEVTFDIDANGIVNVNAKDLGTGKEQSITLTGGTKLADDEINRMIREAEEHAEEDRKRREEAEARNQADSVIYTTEKHLREHGDKLPEEDRKAIESGVEETKAKLNDGSDAETIRDATQRLLTASQKISEVVYQQASAGQAGAAGGTSTGSGTGEEEVVDAEVVDEDEASA